MTTKFNTAFFLDWRKSTNRTQSEILEKLNCTAYETVRNWDKGNLIPTNRLIELCAHYNIPVTNFFLTDGNQTYTEYFRKHEEQAVNGMVSSILKEIDNCVLDGLSAQLILKRLEEKFQWSASATETHSPTLPNPVGRPVTRANVLGKPNPSYTEPSTPVPAIITAEQLQPQHEMELLKLRLAHAEELNRLQRQHHDEMEQYRQQIRNEMEQADMRNQEERMRMSETIETLALENRRLTQMAAPTQTPSPYHAPEPDPKPDHAYTVREDERKK